MPVTQTDQHNTDLTEILLALRLEDFDLAPVLEAVEEMILDYGPPEDGLYAARSYADIELGGSAEMRVKFTLWWKGPEFPVEDDYMAMNVTPVFSVQNGVDHSTVSILPIGVARDLTAQDQLKYELLDAIHGKARRELAFLGLTDDTGF